jgi:hypothetical protein
LQKGIAMPQAILGHKCFKQIFELHRRARRKIAASYVGK